MNEIGRNYMLTRPDEGSCNPCANAERDYSWIGNFDGALYSGMRVAPEVLATFRAANDRPSRSRIKLTARNVLRQAWRREKLRLNGNGSLDPFAVIDPFQVLKDMGYSVDYLDSLGQFEDVDGVFEAAGQFDPSTKTVWISKRLSPEVARFTAAHELGHAMLHRGMSMHRDRPMDGSRSRQMKTPEEADADYFAACFLMPEKLVRKAFAARFLTSDFVLNEEVAFALGYPSLREARLICRTHEDLARVLAGARLYNLQQFPSLTEQLRVSVKAMAYRLLELRLVTTRSLGK
jgi:Zn-dependent peptidase ImmA (M78 family)